MTDETDLRGQMRREAGIPDNYQPPSPPSPDEKALQEGQQKAAAQGLVPDYDSQGKWIGYHRADASIPVPPIPPPGASPSPDDLRGQMRKEAGIPDDYQPAAKPSQPASYPKSTTDTTPQYPGEKPPLNKPQKSWGDEALAMGSGFLSGLKSDIDVPAEKMAYSVPFFGQSIGDSTHAADQKARADFMAQYGTDPYATVGDLTGKLAGAVIGAYAARRLGLPAAESLENQAAQYSAQLAPYVRAGANILLNAGEGYVSSALTEGDRALGAVGGAVAPYLGKVVNAGTLGLAAAAAGWRYGHNLLESTGLGTGATIISHYLDKPITWFTRQVAKVPSITGVGAGQLPNPLYQPDAVTAGAQATP